MLPGDPMMMLSVINTKLRDEYDSLEALCNAMDVDIEEVKKTLSSIGYRYNKELNAFK